jgi:hypothetical protein
MLLRVNQETGSQIVLFRRGLARFDSATLQTVSKRAMQCSARPIKDMGIKCVCDESLLW